MARNIKSIDELGKPARNRMRASEPWPRDATDAEVNEVAQGMTHLDALEHAISETKKLREQFEARIAQPSAVSGLTRYSANDFEDDPAVDLYAAAEADIVLTRLTAERDELRDLLDDKVPNIERRVNLRVELAQAQAEIARLTRLLASHK